MSPTHAPELNDFPRPARVKVNLYNVRFLPVRVFKKNPKKSTNSNQVVGATIMFATDATIGIVFDSSIVADVQVASSKVLAFHNLYQCSSS